MDHPRSLLATMEEWVNYPRGFVALPQSTVPSIYLEGALFQYLMTRRQHSPMKFGLILRPDHPAIP